MGFRARQEALSQVAGGSDCVHGEALSKSTRLAGTAKILNRAPGPPLCGGSVGCAVGPAAGLRHEAAVLCSSAPLPHAGEEVSFAGIATAASRAWCLLKNLVQLLPQVRIREPWHWATSQGSLIE